MKNIYAMPNRERIGEWQNHVTITKCQVLYLSSYAFHALGSLLILKGHNKCQHPSHYNKYMTQV